MNGNSLTGMSCSGTNPGYNIKLTTTPRYLWYDDSIFRHFERAVRDNRGEWVFINSWNNIFFLDAAAIWPQREDILNMSVQDYKFSAGAGFRVNLLGMPVRLYLSQPFVFSGSGFDLLTGDFSLGPLSPQLVFSVSPPGGF